MTIFGNPVALNLGLNTFQFQQPILTERLSLQLSADVAIDLFFHNGDYIVGTVPTERPTLSISSSTEGITLEWTNTAGFEVQYSVDLNSWSSTEIIVAHTIPLVLKILQAI